MSRHPDPSRRPRPHGRARPSAPRCRLGIAAVGLTLLAAGCRDRVANTTWRLDPAPLLAQAEAPAAAGPTFAGTWTIDKAATRAKIIEAGVPEQFADRIIGGLEFTLDLRDDGTAAVRGTSMQGPFEEESAWTVSGDALTIPIREQPATGALTEAGRLELTMPMGPRSMTAVFARETADAADALRMALAGESRPGLSGLLNILPDGTFGLTVTQPNAHPFALEGTYQSSGGGYTLAAADGRRLTARRKDGAIEVEVELDGEPVLLTYRPVAPPPTAESPIDEDAEAS